MKLLVTVFLCACCVGMEVAEKPKPPILELTPSQKVVKYAMGYVGLIEKPGNRGPEIDYWNRRIGLGEGSSYCGSFAALILDSAGVTIPSVRSGVAQKYITSESISANKVLRGEVIIPAGSLSIMKRGTDWSGHVDFTRFPWEGCKGWVIGANTSAGAGSISNGDGVHTKQREIIPTAHLRITHFTVTR